MKSLVILTISGLLACSGIAFAADTTTATEKKGEPRQFPGVEQRMEMLKKQLDLKPEQETKVKALFEQEGKKMREMRTEAANMSPEQRREKMTANRKEMDAKMKEILTPEQFEKWEKARERRDAAFAEKKGPRKGEGTPGEKKGKPASQQ